LALTGAQTCIVAIATITVGYRLFSSLMWYDDEGYMMLAVRQMLDGQRLYAEIETGYGPVYYVLKWLIHGVAGVPLGHDTVRLTTVAVYVLASLLAGLAVYGITDSVLASAATTAWASFYVVRLSSEPGHPQELGAVLLGAIAFIAAWPSARDGRTRVVALGLAVGALAMTKINLGVFAGLAVWLALLHTADDAPPLRVLRLIRVLSLIAALAAPWILMRGHLDVRGFRELAICLSAAVVALGVAARPRQRMALWPSGMIVFTCACMTGLLLGLAFPLLRGASIGDVLYRLILGPQSLIQLFVVPLAPAPWTMWAAGLGPLTAVASRVLLRGSTAEPPARRAGVLAAVTLALRIALGGWAVLAVQDTSGPMTPRALLSILTPFLWLVVVPVAGVPRKPAQQRARETLAWLGVLFPLQIYPVAGSQVPVGTLPHVLCAGVMVWDAVAFLRAWARRQGAGSTREAGSTPWPPRLDTMAAWTAHAGAALLVILALGGALVTAFSVAERARSTYNDNIPLALPGAERVRLIAAQARMIGKLVST
jgi:hypothetical protein